MLEVKTAVFGNFTIEEPVLIELINSKALARLKGISMAGYYPAYPDLSHEYRDRYTHSIGVMSLLRKHGASIEEQIAGLIHDVSHSAFSHTIDYIDIDEGKEHQKDHSMQDDNHEEFIKTTDIPVILEKYDISLDYVLGEENFPLLEQSLPDICADRLEYSLREGLEIYKVITAEEKDYLLDNLIVSNGLFVFKNFESAKLYAEAFWTLDNDHWNTIRGGVMFAISAKMLRHALRQKYINKSMLFKLSDMEIIDILNQQKDEMLEHYMQLLHEPDTSFENNKNDYIDHIYCKSRKVDPLFLSNGELQRVSEVDAEFKDKMASGAKFKEYYIQKKAA